MAGYLPNGITQRDIDAAFEATLEEECFECDCCSKLRPLTRTWTSCGIETFACDVCRGL